MVLRVFEKSAHTKPVLALYKSLLKISSNKSLDPVLSTRLQRRIRNGFRKNQKILSARLVKTNLITAFNVTPPPPRFR
jgi:Complex 1 protein (LYR family)